MRRGLTRLVLVCLWLWPTLAAAQDTGSVVGTVVDRTGAPVAGATVRITGDSMPNPRMTTTSDKGTFAALLLPGEYNAEVEKTGVGKASRTLVIELDRETRCDLILGPIVAEPVSVVAASPDVNLKSTEIKFTYRRAFIQDLPLDRSFLGLMQLVPGVAFSRGLLPNSDASRQDNAFLLDSVNITNPFFGYLSTEINELDISEIDVKRGALRPEFGRTTGMFANATIKSGSNLLKGNYRFEAIPNAFIEDSTKVIHTKTDRWDNAADLGGPLVRDRVFFYGSGRVFRSSSDGAVNLFGAVPNRVEKTQEYFGKVSAQFGTQILNASYRHRPTTIANAGIGPLDAPAVGSNVKATNHIANVNYDWFIGSRMTASLKYVHVDENNESTAITQLGFLPPFHVDGLTSIGRFVYGGLTIGASSLALNRQNYSRDALTAAVTRVVDRGRTSHRIKLGFGVDRGVEDLTRTSNGWGDISYVYVGGRERVRATYYPMQPGQRSTGRTYSLYGQDDITIGSRLTVNGGVLFNRDEFVQTTSSTTTFPAFGFFSQVQPRVGVNFQLRKAQADKVYANWGRYSGLDQKSSARALGSGRLYTVDTDYDLLTEAFISTTPSANTGEKSVAPNLETPITDEVVIGYATPIGPRWSFDTFVILRSSMHFIEDAPTVLPFSTFQFQNDAAAERKYRSWTVVLRRQLQNQWALNVSYAWSRLKGNYDPEYSGDLVGPTAFSAASLMDDGPGAFTDDGNRFGVLSQDRTHVYKVLATWVPKWIDRFSFGILIRGQSGTPWEARGLSWASSIAYLRMLEPAGAHRTPFWNNTDLLGKLSFDLGGRRALRLEARLMNVFNQETVLLVDQRAFLDPRNLSIAGSPAAGCRSCFTDAFPQNMTLPNARLGQPIAFATPRRLLISVLFDF